MALGGQRVTQLVCGDFADTGGGGDLGQGPVDAGVRDRAAPVQEDQV